MTSPVNLPPPLSGNKLVGNDVKWMTEAYKCAHIAKAQGEVPVGAVLVDANQNLLARGWNQVIQKNDPSAHAEVIALREAAAKLNNYRLLNTSLYVTLEPCAMCAGALLNARVQRLIFATRDFKAGAAGSVYNVFHVCSCHKIQIDEGVLQKDCAQLLTNFFISKRPT